MDQPEKARESAARTNQLNAQNPCRAYGRARWDGQERITPHVESNSSSVTHALIRPICKIIALQGRVRGDRMELEATNLVNRDIQFGNWTATRRKFARIISK